MKILVASHTYIVDLNCEKLRCLAQLDPEIEVTVVVPKRWRPGGVQKEFVRTRYWEEGRFRVMPIANFSTNNQGLLSFGWEIVTLLREFQPDIIQVEQGAKSVGYAELITLNRWLKLGAKLVFFTWWNLPYTLKPPVSWLEAYNLRHTDGLIVGNQEGADILQQHGYTGATVVMPQLGVDEQLFQPQPQPELRDRLGIHPDDFVIGFVGRFVPEKGLVTLFKALAQLGDRPWKCLMLGRGPLKDQLTYMATADGIGDRLIWVESVPHTEVPNYINAMDTLVLPSETDLTQFKTLTSVGWKEQFGHVLIEAMACRVPVIGSDSGEIPFVIDQAGLVFPEQQPDALRDRLLHLMNHPDAAAAIAQAGYDRAMQQYTNLALAKAQLEFYHQL